jgi:hypothetical protein
VNQSRAQQIRDGTISWFDDWAWLIVAAAAAGVYGLSRMAVSPSGRRVTSWSFFQRARVFPPLQLSIDVKQASGAQPELSEGFAARVRAQLQDLQARFGQDARVIQGTDAAIEIPVKDLPEKAQYLLALFKWLRKSNTVTLRATLLPAGKTGLTCHVALTEQDGSLTRRAKLPQQTLSYMPEADWSFNPAVPPPAFSWLPLVSRTSAWALFAFRSVQVSEAKLSDEIGTASRGAFGEMLAGLEVANEASSARAHFRRALVYDQGYLEARLNLAAVSISGNPQEVARAKVQLVRVLTELGPQSIILPDDRKAIRERALFYRAIYCLAIATMNEVVATMSRDVNAIGRTLSEIEELMIVTELLSKQVSNTSGW